MLTLVYEENDAILKSHDAADVARLLADPARPFWLDLEAPTEPELDLLRDPFHFHPLAVEDAGRPHQRPKLDEYEGHAFLTADEVTVDLDVYRAPRQEREADAVRSRQMAAFLGEHFLVTVHAEPLEAIRTLRDRCDQNRRVLEKGADFLLYSLLDVLVDGFFPLLDSIDDRMDELEDRIIERPERGILDTIFAMKRDLTHLRRHVGPLREVVNALTTREFPGVRSETLPYFRDVADHLFRVYEALDNYRDLMSNMLDAYLSQVSNEMNRVMQKLSTVATVFLPLTFITGLFGMNFDNLPWAKTNVWLWLGVMAVLAAATVWGLRRRNWL
jgi:magnesium transporter